MMADSNSEDEDESLFSSAIRPDESLPRRLRLLTFLSAIGGFLFGYDTGVISGAMLLIREELSLSSRWQELIVSATVLAACLSSLAGGWLADTRGRRPTILLSSLLFLVGSVIMAGSGGAGSLLAGRLVVGAGVGLASHCVPLYISECSPAERRGELLTINNVAITGGQLVAALVCGLFSSKEDGWRFMLGLASLPALLQLGGFLVMPESPRHLVRTNRLELAERELGSLRSLHHNLREEMEDIIVSSSETSTTPSLSSILRSEVARRSVMLGCLLQFCQQVAGINTVMYYSASILVMAGLATNTSIWLAALTAGINFLFTLVGLVVIARWGRRQVLLASLTTVILSLLLISLSFKILASSWLGSVLAVASLCIYLAGFAPGLGTLPWIINSELHPAWCRATALSLATATNWATNLLVSATFLSLVDTLGRPPTFLLYAALTSVCSVLLSLGLPETSGVRLEQTESLFSAGTRRERGERGERYSLLPVSGD